MRAILLVILAACGCHQTVPQAPPPFVLSSDGADPCSIACAKIVANHCDGMTDASACAAACARDQSQGVASQLNPACVVEAGSVAELKVCGACLTVGP
jgi:hypothetical protein